MINICTGENITKLRLSDGPCFSGNLRLRPWLPLFLGRCGILDFIFNAGHAFLELDYPATQGTHHARQAVAEKQQGD
jgi:hypothetical protein